MNKEEQEAIENLKHIVEYWKPDDENDELANIEYNSIKVAVNLIYKLRKENEALKENNLSYQEELEKAWKENEKLKDRIEYLGNEKHALYQDNISLLKEKYGAESLYYRYIETPPVEVKGYISEDKIRTKIKELEKTENYIISMYAIGILEELLGE